MQLNQVFRISLLLLADLDHHCLLRLSFEGLCSFVLQNTSAGKRLQLHFLHGLARSDLGLHLLPS